MIGKSARGAGGEDPWSEEEEVTSGVRACVAAACSTGAAPIRAQCVWGEGLSSSSSALLDHMGYTWRCTVRHYPMHRLIQISNVNSIRELVFRF